MIQKLVGCMHSPRVTILPTSLKYPKTWAKNRATFISIVGIGNKRVGLAAINARRVHFHIGTILVTLRSSV